jgi:hypothetical protein
MRGRRMVKMVGIGVAFFAIVLVAAALFGLIVMHLWNWLMPALFGVHLVTYWQAVGLLILSWILFRGPRGWRRPGAYRWSHARGRWQKMTPEERERFRAKMREWAGHTGPSVAEGKG